MTKSRFRFGACPKIFYVSFSYEKKACTGTAKYFGTAAEKELGLGVVYLEGNWIWRSFLRTSSPFPPFFRLINFWWEERRRRKGGEAIPPPFLLPPREIKETVAPTASSFRNWISRRSVLQELPRGLTNILSKLQIVICASSNWHDNQNIFSFSQTNPRWKRKDPLSTLGLTTR